MRQSARDRIEDGISSFEAEIEDLQNKLDEAHRRVEVLEEYFDDAKSQIEDLTAELNALRQGA